MSGRGRGGGGGGGGYSGGGGRGGYGRTPKPQKSDWDWLEENASKQFNRPDEEDDTTAAALRQELGALQQESDDLDGIFRQLNIGGD
jgi:hypothetical protein